MVVPLKDQLETQVGPSIATLGRSLEGPDRAAAATCVSLNEPSVRTESGTKFHFLVRHRKFCWGWKVAAQPAAVDIHRGQWPTDFLSCPPFSGRQHPLLCGQQNRAPKELRNPRLRWTG